MGDRLATAAPAAYDQRVILFRAALIVAIGALAAGTSAIAYVVSFDAISLFAMHSGGIAPKHAWAAPLPVDSFIAVAAGAALWWELLWPKLLLAGAVVVSFVLNIAIGQRLSTADTPLPLLETDGSQGGLGVAAGRQRRRRLSAARMEAARQAAQALFAHRDGLVTGGQLQAALEQRELPVSERVCFGLPSQELHGQPVNFSGEPGSNGQGRLEPQGVDELAVQGWAALLVHQTQALDGDQRHDGGSHDPGPQAT